MKRYLLLVSIICMLFLPFTSNAQISYIGNLVDRQWLQSFFESDYSVTKGYFHSSAGWLISGEAEGVHCGNHVRIETGDQGKCKVIAIDYNSPSNPQSIRASAETFMRTNGCSNFKMDIHDDDYFSLDCKGEVLRGRWLISLYVTARGDYNSFGKYFHRSYRAYIITSMQ